MAATNGTYLSWDVGIKNLAYCILDKNESTFKIKHWGIINLVEDNIVHKCMSCSKDAKIMIQDKYYCDKHGKAVKPLDLLDNPKGIYKCAYKLKSDKICGKKSLYGTENESYCKVHCPKPKKVKKINANYEDINKLITKMGTELNKNKEIFTNVTKVLIELQPLNTNSNPTMRKIANPTMKTISVALYSWFIFNNVNVTFVAAGNKIKISSEANKEIKNMKENKANNKDIYNFTKNYGTKICLELIKDDKENVELINNAHKKDDLCDAFIQAYHYLFGPTEEINKIVMKYLQEDKKKKELKAIEKSKEIYIDV